MTRLGREPCLFQKHSPLATCRLVCPLSNYRDQREKFYPDGPGQRARWAASWRSLVGGARRPHPERTAGSPGLWRLAAPRLRPRAAEREPAGRRASKGQNASEQKHCWRIPSYPQERKASCRGALKEEVEKLGMKDSSGPDGPGPRLLPGPSFQRLRPYAPLSTTFRLTCRSFLLIERVR